MKEFFRMVNRMTAKEIYVPKVLRKHVPTETINGCTSLKSSINYTRCSELLNNGLQVGDIVIYKNDKYKLKSIDEKRQKASMRIWKTKFLIRNIPLSELTKIV